MPTGREPELSAESPDQEVTNAAFQVLKHAIRSDDSYAWSWQCGIAMAIVDEIGVRHDAANRAAARFMQMCFDVDVTKSEQWASLNISTTSEQGTPEQLRRGAAVLFTAAGWSYSHTLTAEQGLCNDRTCYRCRLVALLTETENREDLKLRHADLAPHGHEDTPEQAT